jgi:Flp pilus assembly protein TadG
MHKLERAASAFWHDNDGVILPYVTILLVAIVGVGVLAVDGSRYMSLQTQLQQGADALALAGAAELDRMPASAQGGDDSISRATAAINNQTFVVNSTILGSGSSANVKVSALRFLSALPASDATNPIPASYVTTDPTQARFVEVTVQAVSLNTVLPASLFGGANALSTTAQAVAGMDIIACKTNPLFICNPFEQSGDSYATATQRLRNAPVNTSALYRFNPAANNGSATWGPGDFGYLSPTTGALVDDGCFPQAGNGIAQAMATNQPNACFTLNGVTLQPGNAQAARDGLNTRFGLYPNSFKSSCNAAYGPDQNVRKGFAAKGNNWCTATPDASNQNLWVPGNQANSLPLDSPPGSAVGSGQWDCYTYWTTNHPKATAPASWGCSTKGSLSTVPRYTVYNYEISNNLLSDHPNGSQETGAPQCNAANATPSRRILYISIINCLSSPVSIQSNASGVPVAGIGKFFLTIPYPDNSWQNMTQYSDSPYGEFLGLASPTDRPRVIYDQVQLYR